MNRMEFTEQDLTDIYEALDDWHGAVDGDEDVDQTHAERVGAILQRLVAAGADGDTN